MKLKIIFLAVILMASSNFAQSKVGTVNSDYIMGLMPETQTVVKLSESYAKRLDSLFSLKVEEYQKTLVELKGMTDTLIDQEVKKQKFLDLGKLESEVNQAKQNGAKLMRLKEKELMRPLYGKLSKAIAAVAKEQKYTQILTTQGNEFAYIDPEFDITLLVMTKLNIKTPEPKAKE